MIKLDYLNTSSSISITLEQMPFFLARLKAQPNKKINSQITTITIRVTKAQSDRYYHFSPRINKD